MSPKFERFASAVRSYPEFKDQFRKFCATSAILNDNNRHLALFLANRGVCVTTA